MISLKCSKILLYSFLKLKRPNCKEQSKNQTKQKTISLYYLMWRFFQFSYINLLTKPKIMGCAMISSQNQIICINSQRKDQVIVGQLTIAIKSIKLQKQYVHKNTNSILKLRMSNQQFKTPLQKQKDKLKAQDENFYFCVNSLKKVHGRMLVAEILDDSSKSQKDIALGILDLDSYLTEQNVSTNHQQRIYLDYQTKAAGYINICIKFQPYPYQTINFRINTIFIRKNTNSHRDCAVRITIGQEIEETSVKKDSIDSVPTWKNQTKKFVVPSFIGQATIQAVEKTQSSDEILGELTLDLNLVLSSHRPLMHNQVLQMGSKITGSIIFDTVKNKERDYEFEEMISPRKIVGSTSKKISQIGQTKHSINFLSLTECKTDRNISLLTPPIINPKKLPSLNKQLIEQFELDKSFTISAKDYQMLDEGFPQNIDQVKSHANFDQIKLIKIPSVLQRQQHERIRKSSLDGISTKIPNIEHDHGEDALSCVSAKSVNKLMHQSQESNKSQQEKEQNIQANFIAQNLSISQIDQTPFHEDIIQNQSGKQIFTQTNKDLYPQRTNQDNYS